jgi:nucleotide-binding universal stress UspA family protein
MLVVSDFQNPAHHPPLDLMKTLAVPAATMHLLHILQPQELNQVAEIKAHMREFASRNGLEKVEMHLHQENKIDQGVYHFNQDHQMDLVCMGTHARKGLSHLFYGSIAERLINHCSKPVLTYHL